MKEDHFLHGNRSTKHHLIDVGLPRLVLFLTKLAIEVKLLLFASRTRGRIESRFGPTISPLRQKQVM